MFNQKNLFIFKIFFIFILFFIFFCSYSMAAYPQLVSTIIAAFETIKTWIIRIATPAAAVAVRFWYFYEKI